MIVSVVVEFWVWVTYENNNYNDDTSNRNGDDDDNKYGMIIAIVLWV